MYFESQIAITGMAFRFPGENVDANGLWDFLNAGRSAICDTPADRFDIETFYSSNPDVAGKTYARRAGYLKDPYRFDAEFFRISAAEALAMDPQQRGLLELCWSALENAGLVPSELRGQRVGLFLAIGEVDYGRRTVRSGDVRDITSYAWLGSNRAVAAGRVAYFLGVQGPAMIVDTACSSSLVATHLAAQSLRSGDCDIALAGGINLILGPEETIGVARLKAMSTSEACRPFDALADGYMRGEGGGVIVMKRLHNAVADGDRIDAVLAGSAINNDGASNGLTAPNGTAQEDVIRRALAQAKAQPEEVVYVEAHGTGTPLGDPVELNALRNAYTREPGRKSPLLIGSIKSQLGHLEAAAGIAGLVKAILVLRNRFVPGQANFAEPTPRFRWEGSQMHVTPNGQALPEGRGLVAISGFGISGTNAHLILAPHVDEKAATPLVRERVLTLSGRSSRARLTLAKAYREAILQGAPGLRELCYTACVKRDHWAFRLSVVGSTADDFVRALDDFEASNQTGNWHAGEGNGTRKLAFLFPGQGAWRPGVGAGLYGDNPIFRRFANQCLQILPPQVAADVLSAIQGKDPSSVRHHPGQLAHFVVLFSLASTWMELGQIPDVVIGHSLGEHVAAVVAGVMSLEDGLKAVEARGRLFDTATPRGAMLAVAASLDELSACVRFGDDLFVAGVNGPGQTVVSGTVEAVAAVETRMTALGRRVSRLKTYDTPGHSPLLSPMRELFRQALTPLHFSAPRIRLVSTLTGRLADRGPTQVDHWLDLVEQPVRFAEALDVIAGESLTFLEVGPGAALSNLVRGVTQDWLHAIASLADGPDGDEGAEPTNFAHACARLYSAGHQVKWSRLYGPAPRPVEAPTYPFEAVRFELPVSRSSFVAAPDRVGVFQDAATAQNGAGFDVQGERARKGADQASMRPSGSAGTREGIRAIVSSVATNPGPIEDDVPLVEQGFDSLALTELRARLQQSFGRTPPVSLFAKRVSLNGLTSFFTASIPASPPSENHAIEALKAADSHTSRDFQSGAGEPAQTLASGNASSQDPSLAVVLREGSGPLVALVHPIGGDVLCYADLAAAWPRDATVVALRHVDSNSDGISYRSMEQLASCYRTELTKVFGRLPDLLGGWSFGGLIAHEMAAQCEAASGEAPPLCIIDSPFRSGRFVGRLKNIVRELGWPRGLSLVEKLQEDHRFQTMLDSEFGLAGIRDRVSVATFSRLARLHAFSAAAIAWHAPKIVRTPIAYALASRGQNGRSREDVLEHLRLMTKGPVRVSAFDEDHDSIVRAPAAARLAGFLVDEADLPVLQGS
jgi:acyl transferase domain-containing protein/thioesterase domain-containing protein